VGFLFFVEIGFVWVVLLFWNLVLENKKAPTNSGQVQAGSIKD